MSFFSLSILHLFFFLPNCNVSTSDTVAKGSCDRGNPCLLQSQRRFRFLVVYETSLFATRKEKYWSNFYGLFTASG